MKYTIAHESLFQSDKANEKLGSDQIPYALDQTKDDLTLEQITRAGINFLMSKNTGGFFFEVEGGMIDWACHSNDIGTCINEVIDFDKAIKVAYEFYEQHPDETIIVISADHETGGVSLLSNNKDYTQGESGIDIKFATTGHSGAPVMVYAYGASAWKFSGVMENTDLFKKMKELLIDGKK